MKKIKLIVNTISQNYPIIIGKGVASNISKIASENSIRFEKCLMVVDKNIPKNILAKIKRSLIKKKIFIHYIKATEKNKNLNTSNSILKILLKQNFSRQDCLITIGGGITGDLGGFAASVFKRGIQLVNMPTTPKGRRLFIFFL